MGKLKQVRMAHNLQQKRQELAAAEAEQQKLAQKRADFEQRSETALGAIDEVTTETPAEDKEALEATMDQLEAEEQQLEAEENANEEKRKKLLDEIQQMENELNELNTRAREAVKPQKAEPTEAAGVSVNTRKEVGAMNTRKILGMTYEERHALFTGKNETADWLQELRSLARGEKLQRAIENGELTVPTTIMGIVRENVVNYSKLLPYVYLRNLPGEGKILIDGTVHEAVWTDMCGKLNELDLGYTMTEFEGFKLGGYIAICNALLEDSTDPVALGTEIVEKLTRANANGLDKAIVYGKGGRMPLGIVTRLTQTEGPSNANQYERPWKDLSNSNVVAFPGGGEMTPEQVIGQLIGFASNASSRYATGGKVWIMSEQTKAALLSATLSLNAAGAVVAGFSDRMPVTNEPIVTLDFMPASTIVAGYMENYGMVERAGMKIARSEHVRFIEDQTLFKATSRYDGKPIIAEAFVAMHLNGIKPTAEAVTFAEDKANA